MALGNQVPDETLLRGVQQKLMRQGVDPSRVTATVRNGDVTIAGIIDYEYERRSIISSSSSVHGVKRTIDQLRVEKKGN